MSSLSASSCQDHLQHLAIRYGFVRATSLGSKTMLIVTENLVIAEVLKHIVNNHVFHEFTLEAG